jgi:membrane protein DedA with SNARE-associated domain
VVFEALTRAISGYGYFAVAATVALESLGLPLPGEATLVAAAIFSATTHRLTIWWVVAACAAGAMVGSIAAYWIGRKLGFWLLRRYGKYVGFTGRRLKLAQYIFRRHGSAIVFLGRFVAVLRSLAALLAGANHMPWMRFVVFNSAGAVLWAAIYGFGAYYFANEVKRLSGPVGTGAGIAAGVVIVAGLVWMHRQRRARRVPSRRHRAKPQDPRQPHLASATQ